MIVATDNDGDIATGTGNLFIRIDDDSPIAVNDTDAVTEDGTTVANGNVLTGVGSDGNAAGTDSLGADGPAVGGAVTAITGGTIGAARAGSYGSLTLNADGSYTYTLTNSNPSVQGLDAGETLTDVFTYTITDRDGDSTMATLTITINGTNDAPVVTPSTVSVSEEGLAGANADGTGTPDTTNLAVNTGTIVATDVDGEALIYTLGNPGAVLTSGGLAVTWTGVGTGTLTGRVETAPGVFANVITVTINNSGAYTVTLLDQIDHAGINVEDLKTFTVPVSVSDGTATTNTDITVNIEDDSPIALTATTSGTVDEDGLTGGIAGGTGDVAGEAVSASGSVTGLFSAGADSPLTYSLSNNTAGLPALTSGGVALSYTVVGNLLTASAGATQVFTLSLDANTGGWTFTLLAKLDHPAGNNENDIALQFGGLIIATDKDGDSVTATGNLTVTVDDDTPVAAIARGTVAITHDETAGVDAGTNDVAGPLAQFSGVTNVGDDLDVAGTGPIGYAVSSGAFNFAGAAPGADSAWTVTYALALSSAGVDSGVDTSSGQSIFLYQEGNLIVGRVGNASGEAAFAIAIDAVTSQISMVQYLSLSHPNGGNANDSISLTASAISVVQSATDGDGDTSTASVNIGDAISFRDDGPSITASTTQPDLVVDDSTLGVNASASFAGVFSTTFGSDGPAAANSVTYALGINAGATGLFDVATGQQVVLSVVAGTVVGTAGVGGPTVFVVSIAADGTVTLDQQRAVTHNDPADPIETGASAAGLAADNLITITATATDRDGDTATAIANIGSNLQFEDDGPSIIASTTQPILVVDDSTLGVNASASFASVFTPTFGADGAAASNSVTYALQVTAGPSGLVDVATGEAVNLVLNGSLVEGRTASSNQLVFTVVVDTSGNVTLDQIRAVQHNDPADPDEAGASAATLASDNLIRLVATATDRDGDTATATANIGQNLQFKDDGPSVLANGAIPTLTVDETILTTDAGPTSFAGVFSVNYGADGSGSTTYALSVNTGIASGLIDTATGAAVVLSVAGNVVTGRAGAAGPVVFTLTLNTSTGELTLDQQRAVSHNVDGGPGAAHDDPISLAAGAISLTATATDRDGDSAGATVQIGGNIVFEDDGPTLAAGAATNGALTVDETALATDATASFASLFTPTYGADGAGTVGSYALGLSASGVASGVFDVATGNQVFLFLTAGGVVEGRSGTNAGTAAAGPVVFTVSVSAAGLVTLDQIRAVQHSPDSGPDQAVSLAAANLITLTATVTDGDGDTNTATANIGNSITFLDDAGTLGVFNGITVVNAANTIGNGTFVYNQGADGHGSFAITGPTLPGISYSTVQNANGALLTATTDPDGPGGNAPITVFTLQVNSNGTYAFTLVTPQAATTETISLLGLSAGGPTPFVETPDGRVEFTGSGNGVNSSTQGFGIDNQFVGTGESFTIEFHNPGQVGNQPALTNADYVSSIVLRNDNINGSLSIRVTVYNDALGTSEVVYTSLNVTGTTTLIDPVMATFNRVLVEGIGGSGQGVRFTSLDISRTILPSDINLLFNITATDRDGDVTTTSTLNVFVDAINPVVLDLDGDGAEFLSTAAGVAFDYLGDGNPESTAWVGADDGLLAIDSNGNGLVDNGSEIVFGGNGLTDLQGLAANYDSNKDGVLDASDADFAKFGVWQDANSNGVTDAGEFRSLTDAGITSINLVSDGESYGAANGSVHVHGTSSYTKADGTTGEVADASFATAGESKVAANENDQRVLASANTGMASSLVAAGLVAAIAGASESANNQLEQLGGSDFAVRTVAEDMASDTQFDAPDHNALFNSDSGSSGFEGADLIDTAKFSSYDQVEDHADGDFGGFGEMDSSSLLSDLLASTEIEHANFAQTGFAIGSHVDAASEALIAIQQGDMFAKAAIEEVVADALAGGFGEGANVDALLNALAGPANDTLLLGDTLAQQFGDHPAFEALNFAAANDMLDQLASTHMELSAATGQHG
ncbi:MAG: DUF5801 repeats-in-toxin domain-containing protein [Pseudomonadota bacterium]